MQTCKLRPRLIKHEMMTIIQVLSLILLMVDFGSLAQSQNRAIYPDCQCAKLDHSAGQRHSEGAGVSSHTQDRSCYMCYIADTVNGRKVEAQTACPDSVKSSVFTDR